MSLTYILVLLLTGFVLGLALKSVISRFHLSSLEREIRNLKEKATIEIENERKQLILNAKTQILKEKSIKDKEFRDKRNELSNLERVLLQREETLEKRLFSLDKQQNRLEARTKEIENRDRNLKNKESELILRLENIAGITKEEAKKIVMESIQNEAKRDAQIIVNKIEQEAQLVADKKAKDILVSTMQRIVTQVSSEFTITSVDLPNDEMKGRIIGKEGRNIRALETLIGADIIIDDTPEAVVISCFDPIRKEIARRTLEKLILDGRIHPARIEEVVYNITKDVNNIILEEGERTIFDLNMHGMHKDLIKGLGRLYFRTSYGQNVLAHSKEVAIIAEIIAKEIKADHVVAKRAALLHDIGKGMESSSDSSEGHAIAGAELAKRLGESDVIVNAIAAHHNEVKAESIEAIIVQIADSISASRPGARRESLDNYIKRLRNLEDIAYSFEGVQKCYAIQAGRELRIIVDNDLVDDSRVNILAKDIAKKIEEEMKYPGRIKVIIIRETRVIEYAR